MLDMIMILASSFLALIVAGGVGYFIGYRDARSTLPRWWHVYVEFCDDDDCQEYINLETMLKRMSFQLQGFRYKIDAQSLNPKRIVMRKDENG